MRKRKVEGGWALGKVAEKEAGGGVGGKVIKTGQLCMLFFSYWR
jgi:hypothetical protein